MNELTEEWILMRLRKLITYDCNQKQLADRVGVTPSYMSQVLAGTKEPSDKILQLINIRRVVTYEQLPACAILEEKQNAV